jgi:hypothetical protein
MQNQEYCSIDELLRNENPENPENPGNPKIRDEPLLNGWHEIRPDSYDSLRHKLLNFVIYRLNEPPNQDNFECNYR